MGTPRIFNDLLREEAGMQAAWLPLTNTFELGDFGLVSGGVFNKIGNIRSFFPKDDSDLFEVLEGGESSLRFASDGISINRFDADGSVKEFSGLGDTSASISIDFANEDSFYVSGKLRMRQIANVESLADRLYRIAGWRSKYQVVRHVYYAENCTVISSSGAGAKVSLNGSASLLQAFESGAASTSLVRNSNEKIGIELIGERGVLGIRLFKVRWITGGVNLLSDQIRSLDHQRMEVINDDVMHPLQDDV